LSEKLLKHLKKNKGCKSNREVMQIIRRKLDERDLSVKLVKFLRQIFPLALRPVMTIENNKATPEPPKINKVSEMNKHKVFKIYKPHILTFPHKLIMRDGDPVLLEKKAKRFIKTKIRTDYIIIEDTAYIEYFDPRFREEADQIDPATREIDQYRRKQKVSKILPEND
jgi:hypothetical protein